MTVRDPDQLGAVLGKVREIIGAPYIYGLNVSLGLSAERQSQLEAEAHDKALADARSRAERLAQALGVTLDRPLTVEAAASTPTPDMVGQIQVTLQITYSVK